MANFCPQQKSTLLKMLQRHIAVIRFVLLLATRICCFLQAEYKCQSDCLHCFVHDKLVLKGLILGCKSLINIVVWFSIAVTLVALFGLKVYIKYIWKPNFPFLYKVSKWLHLKVQCDINFTRGPNVRSANASYTLTILYTMKLKGLKHTLREP